MKTESGNEKHASPVTSVKIVANAKKKLSREAKRFNMLTARISTLERDIRTESGKLEKILTVFMDEVQPLKISHAGVMLEVAALLDVFPNRKKLGKRQKESVQEMILDLCERAFVTIEPSPEQKAIFDRWSDFSYDETVKEHERESKLFIEQMLKHQMGVDIDMSDIDASPEGCARFKNKMEAELEKKPEGRYEDAQGARRGRKRSTADEYARVEERRKAEEEMKNRGLRSIYIALAKVLHPDTEIDPVMKMEKEETMKQVTSAYAGKDLTALLRLEMEWVHKESLRADSLTDDKLKIYISALEDQVEELNHERAMLPLHPRFHPIAEYARLPEWRALHEVRDAAKNEKLAVAEFTRFKRQLASQAPYKEILTCIEGYLDAYVYEQPSEDELEEYLEMMERM